MSNWRVSGWRVGVGDGQALEDPALQPLHFFRVAVVLVVITEQMEKSVNGEMGEVVVERFALGDRLARHGLVGDDDVTDIWGRGSRFARGGGGE